ncbi:hypothetical protein [Serratia sp. MF2]|uniref:hypothetical protein n=2 Tax=unclassified Serratia (in: enterobacteria) TaxID=2647522 RepID=UPI0027EC4773|nr:hypothetical protein [Serratia sp. MF2]MDQ7100104.1 hypothetical protein [Serratia sp. MF2]
MMKIKNERNGTYDDFLNAILIFESTIDPQKAQYYAENYDNPTATSYQDVEYPGRVIRAQDGTTTKSNVSIKEYFERLGIGKYYTQGSTDPQMFKQMQYATMNYLGFIGYQLSEQDFWDLGYYTHYDENHLPKYYSDVPVSNWANGVRDKVMNLPGKGEVHVTDVNTWQGTFTGKHGINSFDDVLDPDKQDYVAKDHFVDKYEGMVRLLAERGKTLNDYLGTTIRWSECHPVLTPPPGVPDAVEITLSGLLGGAHLRGAEGITALLVDRENRADENGTAILQYVYQFAGYDTPFNP